MTVFESLLNRTGTIARRVRTGDGQGGWVISYTVIGSEPVRVRPATSAERTEAQQEEREITHVLYCLASVDIARGDRVTLDDGLVIDVQAVREPSQAAEHYEVDCREVQHEATEEPGS